MTEVLPGMGNFVRSQARGKFAPLRLPQQKQKVFFIVTMLKYDFTFSNFSIVRLSIPPHLYIRWPEEYVSQRVQKAVHVEGLPVVVDLPESTWPITTTLMCVFSLLWKDTPLAHFQKRKSCLGDGKITHTP